MPLSNAFLVLNCLRTKYNSLAQSTLIELRQKKFILKLTVLKVAALGKRHYNLQFYNFLLKSEGP